MAKSPNVPRPRKRPLLPAKKLPPPYCVSGISLNKDGSTTVRFETLDKLKAHVIRELNKRMPFVQRINLDMVEHLDDGIKVVADIGWVGYRSTGDSRKIEILLDDHTQTYCRLEIWRE